MEPTRALTAFLRNDADVLLLKRSEAVGSYAGRWGGVVGYVDGDPDGTAYRAVRETVGIDPDTLALAGVGTPFTVDDADAHDEDGKAGAGEGTRLVHPYLFDCPTREVATDRETAEFEWVPPTDILRRGTVPDLWEAYDAVRPTVETVRADREHGSAYLSVRALEVLRDEAALAVERGESEWAALAALARELRDARDGMAVISNRVNRVMHEAVEGGPVAVEAAAESGIARALRVDDEAAARATKLVTRERVLTLSRSGTVRTALLAGGPNEVVVAESRPGGEGVSVAEDLLGSGLDVTLTADAAVAWLLGEDAVDVVLFGADAVLPDGTVVNKVGTRGIAIAAEREDVPVYAICSSDKVLPDPPDDLDTLLERVVPVAFYDGPADVAVECPLFDATPADLVSGVVTENGMLDADGVEKQVDELRSLAEWAEAPG